MAHDEQLPSIDLATLSTVTGGADSGMSSMMMPMMMRPQAGAEQAIAPGAPGPQAAQAPGPQGTACACPMCGGQATRTSV